ncbi:NfeD family protein [Segetibacter koreensis]|uniref:NfeD family protein n=1 Tax=Segetibacter koreensis TaxID=398037 RepID=UPI0003802816|nr:nodulation protein NfeD [Segetibacter koreensis]
MKETCGYFIFLLLMPALLAAQTVVSIKINGTINPASADFIHTSIESAENKKAECIIIHLNTPGGLLKSTRVIVGDILESTVPVVVYVSPGGAQAGSAGVFVTLAANVAAMAPGTNIGAAHPVDLQGSPDTIMSQKATNDAAAFIRTIAEKRKRNLQWAEEAVRRSVSITEKEALDKKVIDLIANDERDLLKLIDGKQIELASGTKILHTNNAQVIPIEMGAVEKILNIVSDPNIAYLLMMLGFFGILFELYNPGAILPGIIGVISLILAFYSMHTLPVNYAALALIIFAIILFLLEIKVMSHGMLAIGGSVSLLIGSMMLIRTNSTLEFARISHSVIISSTIVTILFFLFVIGIGLRAQRSKPVTGIEGMMGAVGETLGTLNVTGTVRVHGEVWNAESVSGVISEGEKVRVTGIKDLKLYVEAEPKVG